MSPSLVEYSKSTVPEAPAGRSEPGDAIETDALKVTDCPDTDTSGAAMTEVVVLALATVSVAAGEVDKLKLTSPE